MLTRDADDAFFQRLAERVERDRRELTQLVEEQRAPVRERDLAWPEPHAAAADQRRGGRGVVRRAERPVLQQTAADRLARSRVDARDLQRFRLLECRQHGQEATGEHGLPGSRGADVQQVVAARGRDLERAPREREAAHLAQVDRVVEPAVAVLVGIRRCRVPRRPLGLALQARAQLGQRACHPHLHARDERGLRRVRDRHDHRRHAAPRERVDECKRARDRPHRPVEPELAEHRDAVEHARWQLVGRGEQPERDRQFEARASLAHTARSEVHRYS